MPRYRFEIAEGDKVKIETVTPVEGRAGTITDLVNVMGNPAIVLDGNRVFFLNQCVSITVL